MTIRQLFVYGTLRPQSGTRMARRLASVARYLGPARTRATLCDRGGYPGIFPGLSTDTWVAGDLYELPETIPAPVYDSTIANPWEWLDVYEGCSITDAEPHEFCRTTLEVRTDDGDRLTVQAYVLRTRPTEGVFIENGDYLHQTSLKSIQSPTDESEEED